MTEVILFLLVSMALTPPTYAELVSFLNTDRTNVRQYVTGEYVCWNYACDLIQAAEAADIPMIYIGLDFEGGGHAIVATLTEDRGVVFVEPQLDRPAHVVDGFNYWSWFYGPNVRRNSTILDIRVYEGMARCEYLTDNYRNGGD